MEKKLVVAAVGMLFTIATFAETKAPDAGQQINGAKDIVVQGQKARDGSYGSPRQTVKDPSSSSTGQQPKDSVPPAAVSDSKKK